jgi:hypothetical protein
VGWPIRSCRAEEGSRGEGDGTDVQEKEAQESLEFMKKEEQELKMKRIEEEEALRKQQEETLVAQERALAIEAELQNGGGGRKWRRRNEQDTIHCCLFRG